MNLRVIKKDINFLIGDFIDDCLLFATLHPEKETKNIEILVQEALDFSDNMFDRVNHPYAKPEKEGAKPKKLSAPEIKPFYKAISADLLKGLDELYSKLSTMAK